MLKNEYKIRKLLGNDYHLCTSNSDEWVLFKYYDDYDLYMSFLNKKIMSNKTHTERDLLEFAKKHRKYEMNDLFIIITYTKLIITWLLFLIGIIINNFTIKIACDFVFIGVFIDEIIYSIISEHNFKVDKRKIKERWDVLSNNEQR